MYYFDSSGRPPTPEVDRFATMVIVQLKRHCRGRSSADPVYAFNDRPHQKTNTECGVFCVHFVMRMLGRSGFKGVCSSIGDDMAMVRLRKKIYPN